MDSNYKVDKTHFTTLDFENNTFHGTMGLLFRVCFTPFPFVLQKIMLCHFSRTASIEGVNIAQLSSDCYWLMCGNEPKRPRVKRQ